MDDQKGIFKIACGFLFFLLCLALVIVGQRNVGYSWLGLQMLGLAGILLLLSVYNHNFNKK